MPIGSKFEIAAIGLLLLVTLLRIAEEWGIGVGQSLTPRLTVLAIAILTVYVRRSRQAFVAVAILLTICGFIFLPDGWGAMQAGLQSAAFIAAFFISLTTLRNVAQSSAGIAAGGTYLATQPPGRRYMALTLGGQAFALLLNYGSISLLGSLVGASTQSEPDPEIRAHRARRMLLAIQRGFLASLPWSPMAFAMAITNTVIPGASWASSVGPGIITALLYAMTGWAVDTAFKPKISGPPPARKPAIGTWKTLLPLLFLLLLLGTTVGILHEAAGVSVVGIVMLVVPTISLGWAILQHQGARLGYSLATRARQYLTQELPSNRGELVLLTMAGYIGTVGAPLLAPLIASAAPELPSLPAWAILIGLVWLIPVLGQLGMNPIMVISLIGPSIPTAAILGVSPTAIVTAIAAGWAISGTCSPFTATTLLIGSFGGVSALHVGVRWNGLFVAIVSVVLTLWVLLYAFLLG